MTDWLRVLGYTVLGVIVALGLLGVGWIVHARRKLRNFRMADQEQADIKASRVGWYEATTKESDQSRVVGVPRSEHGDLPRRATGDKRT